MNDREMDALFASARGWNPVDRRMLDRVAVRLESRSRSPFGPFVLTAAAFVVALSMSAPKVRSIADEAVLRSLPKFAAVRFVAPPKTARRTPRGSNPVVTIATPPAVAAPMILEEPPPPERKYLPRAIADFQQLEQDEAVRAYVRAIIAGSDPNAQIADLDTTDKEMCR